MRVLACGCRLDKFGRATPCADAAQLLQARNATAEIGNIILHAETLRTLIAHFRDQGMRIDEIAAWSARAARGAKRRRDKS